MKFQDEWYHHIDNINCASKARCKSDASTQGEMSRILLAQLIRVKICLHVSFHMFIVGILVLEFLATNITSKRLLRMREEVPFPITAMWLRLATNLTNKHQINVWVFPCINKIFLILHKPGRCYFVFRQIFDELQEKSGMATPTKLKSHMNASQ